MTRAVRTGLDSSQHTQASARHLPTFVAPLPTVQNDDRPLQRVLIANRGEIACRIIATCRRLNLTSIAIYADEDASFRHVSEADEAYSLGSINQCAGNPFLNIQLLLETSKLADADAIHPGYGYLSENAAFAQAVRDAGITFIGPSSQAMSTLGDKRNSKEYLRIHGPEIPLIPGFTGSSQESSELEEAAEAIGFPVMLKASAGGGGKGMRIVHRRSQLKDELGRAQSEAQRSFGSSDCILEKYIEAAKHIEIQIVGDGHGNVLSLHERECSVQRRHQKVIEETPSPFITPQKREEMSRAAVRIGELLQYEGAGTVEFVVDVRDSSFYFLEVNTRLQVEHPITEEVTGIDLVALQFFVAAGGDLSSLSELQQIQQQGHAIECRLCAEDPRRNFLPENGTIHVWKEATQDPLGNVRYETAVQSGSTISIYFDPMIAKIIVWAPNRRLAIAKMAEVLANTVCLGIRSNQEFMQSCLLHESFQDPAYTTSLIPENVTSLLKNPYAHRLAEVVRVLPVIPGFVLRNCSRVDTNSPFRHVRSAFRTQRFDPMGTDVTVIKAIDSTSTPAPILYIQDSYNARNSTCTVSLVSLACLELNSKQQDPQAQHPVADSISWRYNAISNLLRNGSVATAPKLNIERRKWQSLSKDGSSALWRAAFVEFNINGRKLSAYCITDASSGFNTSKGEPHRALCHFPALGTSIEYECYSLLTYCESMREDLAEALGSQGGKTVKAPMPCKILSLLKRDGEEVKAGDIVMVIESMKMETNISVAADGVFRTGSKQGDAAEEGKLLCWIE